MIVGIDSIDSSDAASITNTLVSDSSGRQEIPPHLPKLICASLLVSLLAFTFSIIDSVKNFYGIPNGVVATILPFIFTLPHHGATLLLKWLQRHHTASILPWAPSSPRAIAYSVVLVGAWAVSTALCAMSLRDASNPRENFICFGDCTIANTSYTSYQPVLNDYWTALASTLTSAVELVLILCITLVCYLHHRRQNKTVPVAPSSASASVASESKALSV